MTLACYAAMAALGLFGAVLAGGRWLENRDARRAAPTWPFHPLP